MLHSIVRKHCPITKENRKLWEAGQDGAFCWWMLRWVEGLGEAAGEGGADACMQLGRRTKGMGGGSSGVQLLHDHPIPLPPQQPPPCPAGPDPWPLT